MPIVRIGQPKKIIMISGRKVTNQYEGKLQTAIEDLELEVYRSGRHQSFRYRRQVNELVPRSTSSNCPTTLR
jgi:hypothetical protein